MSQNSITSVEELKNCYLNDNRTDIICSEIQINKSKLHLKGLIGSATGLVASSVIQHQSGTHLFILNDKEEAVYFLNDLENLNKGEFTPLFLPSSARTPYQIEKTENANVSMRAEVLSQLNKDKKTQVVVTYPSALSEMVVTRKMLSKNTFVISEGDTFDIDFVDEAFYEFGFEKVDYVFEPGQYAVRGGIVDVFSYSFDHPYRIEFFGDEIESIRKFDPSTQLSVNKLKKATIVPNLRNKVQHETRQSFLEFLAPQTTIWIKDVEVVAHRLEKYLDKAQNIFDKLSTEVDRLKPEDLYLNKFDFNKLLQGFSVVEIGASRFFREGKVIEYNQSIHPSFNKNFELLAENLRNHKKSSYQCLITSHLPKQIERLYAIFDDKHFDIHFSPLVLELSEGFIDKDLKLLCYTDHQIFERYHRFRLKEGFRKNKEALTLKELNQLEPGDFVVHIDHGVGQFSGLQKIDVNGKEQEAIRLTYKGGDILYVSIHSLHRISKYVGKDGTPPSINKLGSKTWQNLKKKTKSKVKELAYDLLKLYAKRKASKGHGYSPDNYLQTELEASFIYEDTPDQEKATSDVKADMESEAPMDRLVCGDVGFGKTEIAIRAAFKAVCDNKQVAVLVPTTILSYQHYKTFSARLKEFPCNIEFLNRFKTAKQKTEIFKNLKEGKIDIIIGTHAIVGKRVEFKDLGLLIIDEEQKFGVAVKDKLKTFKENVDTLTLTATPIPRTLQFSMMGARDLSIIKTPPPNRYPIQTELHSFDEELIRDAISYEVSRGGQVYFVNNRIENIKEVAGLIQRLCPDVRIAIGHGQMDGSKLEEIMSDFINGAYDVLLATTIIESGIDIPNANTMIINNAHQFGLSDLHQLRGRVGRTNKKAFCYLLSPPVHTLPTESRKRLQAIEQFSDLGSGLNIAMRDLDIRGAGNLLGGEQSGFISDIGFETYQKILNEAMDELKNEEFKDLKESDLYEGKYYSRDCALETDFEILLPDDYVNGISERISLYRELDDIDKLDDLLVFKENLRDRFGDLPKQVEDLVETIQLRWKARELGFEKLILKSDKMIAYFIANQESPYYQSEMFTNVLNFLKTSHKTVQMYEKNGSLRMSFPNISSIHQALEILNRILPTNNT